MRALFLSSLLLLACPPPTTIDDCPRNLVNADGNVGFAGGVGGGSGSVPPAPLAFVGTEVLVTAFAPLTSCVSDVRRVDLEVLDPDLMPLPFTLAPSRDPGGGVVSAALRFTPQQGGVHTVRFSFEPALGVRTTLLQAAGDGLAAHPVVHVPAVCPPGNAWPLTDDVVACEDNQRVSLTAADGGTASFPGSQLVVVGTVLWSLDATGSVLERRVFADGGLALTHSIPSVRNTPVAGLHDEVSAMRLSAQGNLTQYRVDVEPPRPLTFSAGLPQNGTVWWVDGEMLRTNAFDGCGTSPCDRLEDLLALDPGAAWRRAQFQSATDGYARPLQVMMPTLSPRYTVSLSEGVSWPTSGFERVPLWLAQPAPDGRRVLVSADRGSLDFTAWPRDQVLRVGRQHVLLKDLAPTSLRIVRR